MRMRDEDGIGKRGCLIFMAKAGTLGPVWTRQKLTTEMVVVRPYLKMLPPKFLLVVNILFDDKFNNTSTNYIVFKALHREFLPLSTS